MDTPPGLLNKSANPEIAIKSTSSSKLDTDTCAPQVSFLEFDYTNLQKILEFGRDLFQMNSTIEGGENQINNKMLRVITKKKNDLHHYQVHTVCI